MSEISINVVEEYNQFKLAQERHINELIKKINDKGGLGNNTKINLNIEGCITDYPATPKFIDYFLSHLSKQNGKKNLHIKIDGLGNKEVYLLYILVLEGNFFGISNKIESEEEVTQWKNIINEKLKSDDITLKIVYTPNNTEYNYGY